jgi:peptidyl-dipeptidase A
VQRSPSGAPAPLAAFIDDRVREVEPLFLRYQEASWQANVTGADAYVRESAELDAQIRTIYSSRESFQVLEDGLRDGAALDPMLRRQLALLHNTYRAHQIDPEHIATMVQIEKRLEQRFNSFRAELDGESVTENALKDVLRTSDDVARRQAAWDASKQVGAEVVDELKQLVRLRNQAAKQLGFSNYYSMMLELDELDEGELFGILDTLERDTRQRFTDYKRELDAELATRFKTTPDALRPWHYPDPFFQETQARGVDLDRWFENASLEDLTRKFFTAVGLELGDLLERADLYEKPGKCQHAFCMAVDRREDIRVLCNLRSTEQWMGTMLHEYGHAVYDRYLDPNLPWLLRQPAHTLTTEASAMLFGRLSRNAAWLERYAGVQASEARPVAQATARATRSQLLVMTRWCLVMANMERALYRDPEQDLDRLWWDLVERLQMVRRPEGRKAPDWASKIHFSVAPVYYHNYMLGEMMASQVERRLMSHAGGDPDRADHASWDRYISNPSVGRYLIEHLYRPGKSVDWRQAIQRTTGEPLNPAAFVAGLAEV